MAEPKTRKTDASVKDFIAAVPHEQRRKDAAVVAKLMSEVTGERAAMWGPSIIGFGSYESPTGPWPIAAFSPRKANLVVYVTPGFTGHAALLRSLGPHKAGTSCRYLGTLEGVDLEVLRKIVRASADAARKT